MREWSVDDIRKQKRKLGKLLPKHRVINSQSIKCPQLIK